MIHVAFYKAAVQLHQGVSFKITDKNILEGAKKIKESIMLMHEEADQNQLQHYQPAMAIQDPILLEVAVPFDPEVF